MEIDTSPTAIEAALAAPFPGWMALQITVSVERLSRGRCPSCHLVRILYRLRVDGIGGEIVGTGFCADDAGLRVRDT